MTGEHHCQAPQGLRERPDPGRILAGVHEETVSAILQARDGVILPAAIAGLPAALRETPS